MRGNLAAAMLLAFIVGSAAEAGAKEWFVAAGAAGDGTSVSPFGHIQAALNVAQAGDTITVGPGTYPESLSTVRNGSPNARIHIRAQGPRGSAMVTFRGRVLDVRHAYITVDALVFDGQYGPSDTIVVYSAAHHFTLRNCEVRRSALDLVDIRAPHGVLIDGCLIHHALNATNGRVDAHGVVAGAARDLMIRNTEIHTFSGDGFQIDPDRSSPGWDRVVIEGSRIWLAPLTADENGFAAGTVPGENAVDTKGAPTMPRANIVIRDTIAWGFRNGLIDNMAAFNLKEHVNAILDRVTVYDSDIGFRLRGRGSAQTGAWVTIKNAVVHNTARAFRYEDDIRQLRIWNSTLGRNVVRAFQAASSNPLGVDVRNMLVLGTTLPTEAAHPSNRVARPDAFVDVNADNYALAAGAAAIDVGVAIFDVTTDRAGTPRPQGAAWDVGAFERIP